MAADRVIEKAKPVAAHMLEASADDIEFAAGAFTVRGTDSRKTLAEVVWETFTSHDLPEGVEPSSTRASTTWPTSPSRTAPTSARSKWTPRPGQWLCVPRLGRRHRRHHQPAHRRGADPRRHRPRGRAGPLGGGGPRRAGHAGDGLLRRLHPPHGSGPHQLHQRQHGLAVDDQRPRRQGRGGGGAASPPHRPWSTPSWTRSGRWASTTSGCRAPLSGCEAIQTAGRSTGAGVSGGAQPHFDEGAPNQDMPEAEQKGTDQ